MFVWPALLLAPLLALAEQAIVFAMTTSACAHQAQAWLHGIALAFVTLTLLCTVIASIHVKRIKPTGEGAPHLDADIPQSRDYFLARIAVWSGSLSTLAIVAMWVPQWVLSACVA